MGLYLDYNASAPMLNSSIDAMVESMKLIGNPSSIHSSGRRAKNAIEDSRELVAEAIDITPQNIIFTSGASESNSLAFKYAEKMKIITSAIEHESVLEHKKMDSIIIPVNQNGIVNLADDNTTFKWSKTGKKILTVPFDEHPYTAFARFLKTDEGINVMKAIEKKLT